VVPLLRPKKEERRPPFDGLIAREEQRDLEEHLRLLYVAMTRAADRLIVSGVAPRPKKDGSEARPAKSWHLIVEQAMAAQGAEPADLAQWGTGLAYGSPATGRVRRRSGVELPPVSVPAWALQPPLPETRPPRPLAPSAIGADSDASPPPSDAMRAAARRGSLIHQLLERLVPVAVEDRRDCALRWLEHSAGVHAAEERAEIADSVCNVLSDAAFAPLFGPGSLGEAPLAATLPDGRVIAGTADRLLVEPDRILVIDFKTGRVPDSMDAIPGSHRAQMAAYAQALGVIFPGREVRAALLYTAAPQLFELVP